MITRILSDIESDIENQISIKHDLLATIKSVTELLGQIDFSSEVVPYEDIEKLSNLMVSLKGKELNEEEMKLIYLIVQNNEKEKELVIGTN